MDLLVNKIWGGGQLYAGLRPRHIIIITASHPRESFIIAITISTFYTHSCCPWGRIEQALGVQFHRFAAQCSVELANGKYVLFTRLHRMRRAYSGSDMVTSPLFSNHFGSLRRCSRGWGRSRCGLLAKVSGWSI